MAHLKHQIPIMATRDVVYAALTTEAGLRGWWTADSRADGQIGGEAEFGFDHRGIVFRMKIEILDPNERIVWRCHGDHPEWNGTVLTWTLGDDGGATILRFTHSGWRTDGEFFASCNATWGELMYRLKHYAEGKNPGPHWPE